MKVRVSGHYSTPEPTTTAVVDLTEEEQKAVLRDFDAGDVAKAARVGYFICTQMKAFRAANAKLEESRDLEIKL